MRSELNLKQHVLLGACLIVLLFPAALFAQTETPSSQRLWSWQTRGVLTGTSEGSEPAGYKVYSGIGLEVGVRRNVGRWLSAELIASLHSREVAVVAGAGEENLGSIEALPLNILIQVRPPMKGSVHPYAGAGLNFTVFWEKSGALDSLGVPPSAGIAFQAGVDFDLSPSVLANVDLRSNRSTTELEADGVRIASLRLHPLTLGFGVGFRF